ncbi:peptidase S41 [Fluviicola taffensis DSM 16823]|uniref:Peptidase S41 n=2 Tax=Fluviicola TaxID=332102 RepID=F2ICR5_FLUTR|nr:peptidase S41 [Fluviicola taffensis DSM 16823]
MCQTNVMSINLRKTALFVLICACAISCGVNNKSQVDSSPNRKESVVEKLKELDYSPVEERISLYYKLKKEHSNTYDFRNELELTLYGYSLLWSGKTNESIAIFQLLSGEFPTSSNAYDCLGDAYLANSDSTLAMKNYKISLEMDPENFHAEDQILLIQFPDSIYPTSQEKFSQKFLVEEYKADLDELGQLLLKIHPNALKFISKEAFLKVVEAKKALINDQTTYGEFTWHCSEIVASVQCSHTSGGFYYENEMLPSDFRFPLQTHLIGGHLVVVDPLSNTGKVKVKDEIIRINGVSVSNLVSSIYPHISAQGLIQTTKRHVFNWWSTGMIAYALGLPEKYTVTLNGSDETIELDPIKSFTAPYDDPLHQCRGLCLEVRKDKTALLTIESFNYYPWNNLNFFEHFMDSTFKEISQKDIHDLIIDVRFNFGGSSESSIYLLRYLAKKPFVYYSRSEFEGKTQPLYGENEIQPFKNRYKGQLWFLIDGVGNSTTGHFMSLVKTWKLGTIVGEELGSNQFCSAGQKIRRLKNTKMLVFIADNTHESTATTLPDETGILPDYQISQSMEDYFERRDVVKEYALELIRKK